MMIDPKETRHGRRCLKACALLLFHEVQGTSHTAAELLEGLRGVVAAGARLTSETFSECSFEEMS